MLRPKPHQTSEGQEALKWLDDNSLLSVATSADPKQQLFVPSSAARKYFDGDRLKRILTAVCPLEFYPKQLSLDVVHKGYVLVFLILLRLDQAATIREFLLHTRLSDRYLPFDEHTSLPAGVPKEEFLSQQLPFCAVPISQGESHFQSQLILPITQKEEIARGGSAIIHRVQIHAEYDELERIPGLDVSTCRDQELKIVSDLTC